MNVPDYTKAPFGLLVKHSPHWVRESNYKPDRHKIGMIVDWRFYDDPVGVTICYPVVHWEGEVMGHACHPANIVPYRKKYRDEIPWKKVSG